MWPELTIDEWKRWSGVLRRGTPEWEAAWKHVVKQTGDDDRLAQCPITARRA